MKVIGYGSSYEIYENDLKTYDALPAQTYMVRFNPMSGFSLGRVDSFEQKEEKIYGNHEEKIEKVLRTFDLMERSLGIILSGEKGIGKSLFTQLLSFAAIKKGIPVIIVNRAYKGIATFIDSIDQEALILFDEFEKVFDPNSRNENSESQNDLLGLFDGMSQKKRMYAITVNNIHRVSEFMVNRPGRFHYHIRFDYPESEEIRTYLSDKVAVEYHAEIERVCIFARKIKLNYDCLRAIAFELNMGNSFEQAIGDLNILNIEGQIYDIELVFHDAPTVRVSGKTINLFKEDSVFVSTYPNRDSVSFEFLPRDLVQNETTMVCQPDKVTLFLESDNDIYLDEKVSLKHLIIRQAKSEKINFAAF